MTDSSVPTDTEIALLDRDARTQEIYAELGKLPDDAFRERARFTLAVWGGAPDAVKPVVKKERKTRALSAKVQPGDVPISMAAHRMGMTSEAAFLTALPNLIARGFPKPDPDTGNFDLDAIDAWRRTRHPHLFQGRAEFGARDASTVVQDRIAASRGSR